MNVGTCKSLEEDHERLLDDTKLELKQLTQLGYIFCNVVN